MKKTKIKTIVGALLVLALILSMTLAEPADAYASSVTMSFTIKKGETYGTTQWLSSGSYSTLKLTLGNSMASMSQYTVEVRQVGSNVPIANSFQFKYTSKSQTNSIFSSYRSGAYPVNVYKTSASDSSALSLTSVFS